MSKKLLAIGLAAALHANVGAQETIKIGVMTIDTGPMAVYNNFVTQPIEMAIDTFNAQGGALGRKYEIVQQAHSGPPAAAVAAATKLAQQSNISFLFGPNTSAIASAISPKLSGLNALYFDSGSALEDLIGKNCQPNYFRTSPSESMLANMMRAAVQRSGLKTWNILSADYSAGHDLAKQFTTAVQESGGSVQTTLFAPLSAVDFGNYIAQLGARPAEGLFVFYFGAGSIAFAKQQQQFGLFPKYKQVHGYNFASDMTLPALGDTVDGVYNFAGYVWDMPGEKNAAFVKVFEQRYKRKPNSGDIDNYIAVEALHQAILKAKSTDIQAVRAALSGLKFNTMIGDVELRAADHQMVRPMVLAQASKGGDGKLVSVTRLSESGLKLTPPPSPECKMPAITNK